MISRFHLTQRDTIPDPHPHPQRELLLMIFTSHSNDIKLYGMLEDQAHCPHPSAFPSPQIFVLWHTWTYDQLIKTGSYLSWLSTCCYPLPKISVFWKDSLDLTCICTNDQYLTFSGGAGWISSHRFLLHLNLRLPGSSPGLTRGIQPLRPQPLLLCCKCWRMGSWCMCPARLLLLLNMPPRVRKQKPYFSRFWYRINQMYRATQWREELIPRLRAPSWKSHAFLSWNEWLTKGMLLPASKEWREEFRNKESRAEGIVF